MSQIEKLLARIKNNPRAVRFDELEKILRVAGYSCRQPRGGSSHYTYLKQGELLLTIPRTRGYVKEVYVRKVLDALTKE